MLLKIDQEFKDLIPSQQPEEYEALEISLLKNGFDPAYPIILWDGILLDGHNRYEICQKHGIEFKTIDKGFSDRIAAYNWIIDNQLSRRNITVEQRLWLIGKTKRQETKETGGDKRSKQYKEKSLVQNEPLISINTVTKIARKYKTSVYI